MQNQNGKVKMLQAKNTAKRGRLVQRRKQEQSEARDTEATQPLIDPKASTKTKPNSGSQPSLVQCVKNRSIFEWLICPVQFGCSIIHGISCSSKPSRFHTRIVHNLWRETNCVCTIIVQRYCKHQLIVPKTRQGTTKNK